MKDKYIIKVNGIEYHSYKELCTVLDIDFKEFMKVKHKNPDISQLELLNRFYDKVLLRMDDSSFYINPKNRKIEK